MKKIGTIGIPNHLSSFNYSDYFRSSCFSSISPFSIIPKTLKFCKVYPSFMPIKRTMNIKNFACFSSFVVDNSNTPPSSIDAPLQIKPKPKPWLLVELENPGQKYNATRHNVTYSIPYLKILTLFMCICNILLNFHAIIVMLIHNFWVRWFCINFFFWIHGFALFDNVWVRLFCTMWMPVFVLFDLHMMIIRLYFL